MHISHIEDQRELGEVSKGVNSNSELARVPKMLLNTLFDRIPGQEDYLLVSLFCCLPIFSYWHFKRILKV